jgi:thioredoxin-related protein
MCRMFFFFLCGMQSLFAQDIEVLRAKYQLKVLQSAGKDDSKSVSYYAYYFFSPECPLCVNYTAALKDNALQEHIKSVVIIPGQENRKVTRQYLRKYLKGQEVFRDQKLLMTKSFDVKVTPEVILLTRDGELVYQGLIDDWVIALGKHKEKASRFYVKEAYTAHRSHQEYMTKTEAIGCFINRPVE